MRTTRLSVLTSATCVHTACLAAALLGLAACGAGSSDLQCSQSATCPNGAPIEMCAEGSSAASCERAVIRVGEESFECAGCGSCQAALQSAAAACAGAPPPRTGDSKTTPVTPALRTTIAALRDPAAPARPPYGTTVEIAAAVVTAVKSAGKNHGFYVQDPTAAAWAGIYVHVGNAAVAVEPGAVVRVRGVFGEFRKLDELKVASGDDYARTGSAPLPSPIEVAPWEINDGGLLADELQSMLLRVRTVHATTPTRGTDFTVVSSTRPTAPLIITSFVANDVGPSPIPAAPNQVFSSITGIGYVTGPAEGPFLRKLAPRGPSDLQP